LRDKNSSAAAANTDSIYRVAESAPQEAAPGTLLMMPPDKIAPMPHQPRSSFEAGFVEELAHNIYSVRSRGGGVGGSGILQALIVRFPPGVFDPEGGVLTTDFRFHIVAGETRFWAALHLRDHGILIEGSDGDQTPVKVPDILLPVIVQDISEADAHEYALMENEMRRNLKPLDVARSIRSTMNRHNLSMRQMSERMFGTANRYGYIKMKLDILKAGEDVQVLLDERPESEAIVQRINNVKEPEARARFVALARAGLSEHAIRDRIREWREGQQATPPTANGQDGQSASSSPAVYGTPKAKGVRVVAQIDIDLTLATMQRQASDVLTALRTATVPKAARRNHAPRLRELSALVVEIQKELDEG
jgi:ParB-like chromosome segregation protein Spo0J